MSLNKSEKIETNRYELEFSVDKATFDAATDKVFRREAVKINVPGFRKGKAPRAIIEKMYGKGVFYEDAVNEILPDAYEAALKESGLDALAHPEFDIVSVDENGLVLKAKVYVKPEVEVKDYAGIKAERKPSDASDEEVDAEIQKIRERNAREIEITDRAAQKDDIAVIDYEGSVDGVPFDGGKADGHNLTLGSGQFIPGFEEQIIGHNAGDSFDVNVTFPTEYHAKELAGKAAVFKVKLNAIKFNELPNLDDEFAKDVSEFETIAEYKADMKAKLEERKKKAAESDVEEQLINTLTENMTAEIPPVMVDDEVENLVRDYDTRLRMQGLDLKTYFKYTGLDLDALRKQFRGDAERQVKTRLALEKIVALENITATDEEIDAEYENLAKAYNMKPEEVKSAVDAKAVGVDLCVKKAVDFIKEKAVITNEAPKAAKKAPAKKPAAKKAPAKKADEEPAGEENK